MCFAPQRRALFQHLNFQKWSDAAVFCAFSLRNRLRATTACNFSSLISPDVSAPAALASLLFNPPEPQNHEKTQCFATFLPFRAPASSFFWSFLFWLFSLLTAFSSLHIVGSSTFNGNPQWISSILDTPDASGPRYMWFPTKTHGFRSGSLRWSTVNFMTYPITNVAGKSQKWKVITGKNHWVIYMSLGFHSHVWFPMISHEPT